MTVNGRNLDAELRCKPMSGGRPRVVPHGLAVPPGRPSPWVETDSPRGCLPLTVLGLIQGSGRSEDLAWVGGDAMTPMRLSIASLLVLLTTGGILLATQQPAPEPRDDSARSIPLDEDARAQARWIYDTRCSFCHGPTGRGDGEGARGLEPAPSDFASVEALAVRGSGHVEAIILGGGPAVGRSAAMPPNPDLKGKPGVVAALRDIVRELAQPHGPH